MNLSAKLERTIRDHGFTIARATRLQQAAQIRLDAHLAEEIKFEGLPCTHGHSGLRYTSSGCCTECVGIKKSSPLEK